jgi:hypothetical protein
VHQASPAGRWRGVRKHTSLTAVCRGEGAHHTQRQFARVVVYCSGSPAGGARGQHRGAVLGGVLVIELARAPGQGEFPCRSGAPRLQGGRQPDSGAPLAVGVARRWGELRRATWRTFQAAARAPDGVMQCCRHGRSDSMATCTCDTCILLRQSPGPAAPRTVLPTGLAVQSRAVPLTGHAVHGRRRLPGPVSAPGQREAPTWCCPSRPKSAALLGA